MRLSVIAAMDRNGLIGCEHGMPWRLPRDLQRFRALTWGRPIIMGRTTREHVGRALPGRDNIVLSRRADTAFAGCSVASSFEAALQRAGAADEVFVIGGAQVYREAVPRANRLYLTVVDGNFEGITYFPVDLVRPDDWSVVRREVCEPDEKNAHRHLFLVLDRREQTNRQGETFDLSAALNPSS